MSDEAFIKAEDVASKQLTTDGDVGICISGGGIRSAAFALGALQALQGRLGLLRGPHCATWVSAVSGGSYIAGAFTLVSAGTRAKRTDGSDINGIEDLPEGKGPFEPGSPEADHLVHHCRYLIEDGGARTSLKMFALMCGGITVLAFLLFLIGASVGVAATTSPILPRSEGLQRLLSVGVIPVFWLCAIAFRISRNLRGSRARLVFAGSATLLIMGAIAVTVPSLVARLADIELLASPGWLVHRWPAILLAITLFVALPAVALALQHVKTLGRGTLLLVAWLIPKAVGVLGIVWSGIFVYNLYQDEQPSSLLLFLTFGVMLAAWFIVLGEIPDLISPHRPYRDMVARCFAVIRTTDGAAAVVPAASVSLASLEPEPRGTNTSFPTLLICAAANVSDVGASPAGTNVLPFVMSPTEIYIPGMKEARLTTKELERRGRAGSVIRPSRGREPLLSLATAVAITGAAVAPVMGRMTRGYLRPFLTAFNVRLGVWLPNPLSESARTKIADANLPWESASVDKLALELFGRYSSKGEAVYVSDGGHYENCGLVELVRRRCSVIWCIDGSNDKPGSAASLAQSLLLAEAETGATINIDLARFDRDDDGTTFAGKPRIRFTFGTGTIEYSGGELGRLIVVKLGISKQTPRLLEEYQAQDLAFPYHSTMNQTYRAERFISYRRLGWDSTSQALTEVYGPEVSSEQASSKGSGATRR